MKKELKVFLENSLKVKIENLKLFLEQTDQKDLETMLILSSQIIFLTLSVCGRKSLLSLLHSELLGEDSISHIVIDEASQATEPECLIALQYNARRVVIVGDPMQLPATILSPTLVHHTTFPNSLLSRIFQNTKQEKDKEQQTRKGTRGRGGNREECINDTV